MQFNQHNYAPGRALYLSAQEIATLLLLLQAPLDAMAATPDAMALRKAGLVQLVESEQANVSFAITEAGKTPSCG